MAICAGDVAVLCRDVSEEFDCSVVGDILGATDFVGLAADVDEVEKEVDSVGGCVRSSMNAGAEYVPS